MDHVILAESDRVRLQSPRAVFVLGVNEGIFPANGATAGLFSTREREELNARGAELPVLGTESTLREQFVLYSALSAAAERLTITYARQNIAGDAQLAPAGLSAAGAAAPAGQPHQDRSLPGGILGGE